MMLELRKLRRSCLFPVLALGALLAAALPALNMAVRTESYIHLPLPPLEILVQANWDIIAMINSFLMITAACIIYHIEFADNAIQRMDTLPIRPGQLFLCKLMLLAVLMLPVILVESAGLAFCAWHWFAPEGDFMGQLLRFAGSAYLTSLPPLALMLAASSICRSLWTALGIGVTGVFTAQLLINVPWMRFFPFMMVYSAVWDGTIAADSLLRAGAAVELIALTALGPVLSRIRRNAQ